MTKVNGWNWLFGLLVSIGFIKYHQRHRKRLLLAEKDAQVRVGLLRLRYPTTFRESLANDVLIEESVKEVGCCLTIFVDAGNDVQAEYLNYLLRLFTEVYEIACLYSKPQLKINIVPDRSSEGFVTWKSLLFDPELQAVYSQESEYDEKLHAERLQIQQARSLTYHPLSLVIQRTLRPEFQYFDDPTAELKQHDKVVLGGTFDHLHNGHKKLLLAAISVCRECLIIGITSKEMLRSKKYSYLIDPLEKRKAAVREYIASIRPDLHVHIETLQDPFGPSVTIDQIGAIVVSSETTAGGLKINEIRQANNMNTCEIYVVRRTNSATLSSSYLRHLQAS